MPSSAALSVADSAGRKLLTEGSTTYLVTMSFAGGKPKLGQNEVTDLSLALMPEMPAMGHGSSSNVNPIDVANGLSVGLLNFTMSGDWVVPLDVLGSEGRLDIAYSL